MFCIFLMTLDFISDEDRPSFITSPHDLSVIEGSEAVFECRVSGIPEPRLTW